MLQQTDIPQMQLSNAYLCTYSME